ncbi:MAG: ACP S-malonyltransferase [Spirochaetales bacterium]|nr:ACP S-malonyltransferase [Spirochaetales bacterium]
MKNCFLYPGQGSQYTGMGKDIWEKSQKVKDLFTMASDIVGKDMAELIFEAPEDVLKRTDNTQPAITLVNASVKTILGENGIFSDGCAGVSLGEYAALEDAGIISLEELFALVKVRGELMQAAGDKFGSGDDAPGMAAVIGLTSEKIDELFGDGAMGVYPANYNAPTQIVLAGTADGLAKAESLCKENGARRYIKLKVSAPFHSPFLEEARVGFAEELKKYNFKDPNKKVYSNVTGKLITTGQEAMENALAQVIKPVRWTEEEASIQGDDYERIIETGPGKVLTGLWKSVAKELPCLTCGTLEQVEGLL